MKSIMLFVCGLLVCAAGAFPLNPSFTPEAVKAYKAKADAGDAEAQYLYSSALANGRGVAEDKPQAFAYAKKAAEQGYERVLRRVGLGYKEGWGVESNAVKAADCFARFVKWATEAAENGDANAQCNLGWCYEGGDGVESNMTEAVKWYRKAAEQNICPAELFGLLGVYYAKGEGVEKDMAEAIKWWRKAAEQGNVLSQLFLGWCYAKGKGVAKNKIEALKWYRKAAAQYDVPAQLYIDWCNFEGDGVLTGVFKSLNKLYRRRASREMEVALCQACTIEMWIMGWLITICLTVLYVLRAEYSPSTVLRFLRTKRSFASRMLYLKDLLTGAVALIGTAFLAYGAIYLYNVSTDSFCFLDPLVLMMCLLALQPFSIGLAASYAGIRQFMNRQHLKKYLLRPHVAFGQYVICMLAEMSVCFACGLFAVCFFALVGCPILIGVCALALMALLVYTWPTRKKYDKLVNGGKKE